MKFLVILGATHVYFWLRRWVQARPESQVGSGLFCLFGELLNMAFMFWLFGRLAQQLNYFF